MERMHSIVNFSDDGIFNQFGSLQEIKFLAEQLQAQLSIGYQTQLAKLQLISSRVRIQSINISQNIQKENAKKQRYTDCDDFVNRNKEIRNQQLEPPKQINQMYVNILRQLKEQKLLTQEAVDHVHYISKCATHIYGSFIDEIIGQYKLPINQMQLQDKNVENALCIYLINKWSKEHDKILLDQVIRKIDEFTISNKFSQFKRKNELDNKLFETDYVHLDNIVILMLQLQVKLNVYQFKPVETKLEKQSDKIVVQQAMVSNLVNEKLNIVQLEEQDLQKSYGTNSYNTISLETQQLSMSTIGQIDKLVPDSVQKTQIYIRSNVMVKYDQIEQNIQSIIHTLKTNKLFKQTTQKQVMKIIKDAETLRDSALIDDLVNDLQIPMKHQSKLLNVQKFLCRNWTPLLEYYIFGKIETYIKQSGRQIPEIAKRDAVRLKSEKYFANDDMNCTIGQILQMYAIQLVIQGFKMCKEQPVKGNNIIGWPAMANDKVTLRGISVPLVDTK